MKVCILGIQNIKHMTLISIYTDYFRKNSIAYDLIYIDKYGIDESVGADKVYKFDGTKKKYNGILGKLLKVIDFRNYAKKILKENKYDFVVVWREQTAFMFAYFLQKNYRKKYSVNIRDLWNLNNKIFTLGVRKAVENSLFNTISSEGFKQYLPKAEYLMVHSANKEIIDKGFEKGMIEQAPIRITYIGTLRFENYCLDLIRSFNNDKRFILEFIGQGSEVIADFCKENHYVNVICEGSFEPSETNKKLRGVHIINCAFGTKEIAEKMLTPIRFYYAVYAGIPIMTADETWLNELSEKYGMGITVPVNLNDVKNLGDIVYKQYQAIEFNEMIKKQNELREEISLSHLKFINLLDSIFENNEE